VRRVDASGDGGMADPGDLLWINRRADGKWNPFLDRLTMTPILQLDNVRYAVRSDWAGERLALEKLIGAGDLELSLPTGKKRADFLSLEVVLTGREGSFARLDLAEDKVNVPVGEYSLFEITTVMKDAAGGDPWLFRLGQGDDGADATSYTVKANGRVPVCPIGPLKLTATLDKKDLRYRPGETILVRPQLETADHMMVLACYRSDAVDSSKRHPGVEIRLTDSKGKILDSAQSGFG
jgi:hypothetical protein